VSRVFFTPDIDTTRSPALNMEAIRTSETRINVYQTTRRHIPEDRFFDSLGLGNLICVVLIVSSVGFLRAKVNGKIKQMHVIAVTIFMPNNAVRSATS
jgi:hypothetical protein